MMRYPDVSSTHIVFVYADDIWIVLRSGGVASPLASPPGGEGFPRFSPDGRTIAFNGNYDGNYDIYTVALEGGIPQRVTYHSSGERLCDWSFDNQLLFAMNGLGGLGRQSQLFTVPMVGGLPNRLPVPYGGYGTISGDGQWLGLFRVTASGSLILHEIETSEHGSVIAAAGLRTSGFFI
jgi:tricorn protease